MYRLLIWRSRQFAIHFAIFISSTHGSVLIQTGRLGHRRARGMLVGKARRHRLPFPTGTIRFTCRTATSGPREAASSPQVQQPRGMHSPPVGPTCLHREQMRYWRRWLLIDDWRGTMRLIRGAERERPAFVDRAKLGSAVGWGERLGDHQQPQYFAGQAST